MQCAPVCALCKSQRQHQNNNGFCSLVPEKFGQSHQGLIPLEELSNIEAANFAASATLREYGNARNGIRLQNT